MKTLIFLSVIVSFVWCSQFTGIKTTESFNNSIELDVNGNYFLFWNLNDTHVTFEVHVKTKGWVGFGLSNNGKMFPADVVVGWVRENGSVYFSDRHTVGHSMPVVDRIQDWVLLHGEENEFGTVLKFVRKINTCDKDEDKAIPLDTVRLIYAYSQNDPGDANSITYHGTTRGTKSLSVLRPSSAGKTQLPENVKYFDFRNGNFLVPTDKTTYHCIGFKIPQLGKHHIIKFEAMITPGNEQHVHHMALYRCKVTDPDRWDGVSGMCYKNRTLPNCYVQAIAWAIGGEPYYFPDHVGFPFGGPDEDHFFVMETHYDNPTQKAHMIDNSGFRLTITSNLRQYDAGMLTLGTVSDDSTVIPPGLTKYVYKTFCMEDCLNWGLAESNMTEIKAFATLQHAHLIASGITTRHYRNGTELPPLITDENYDFNFQQTLSFPKEVSIIQGDSLQVHCIYDTKKKNVTTFGGFSTAEEMCNSFVYYYPKMKLTGCFSRPLLDNFPYDTTNKHQTFENIDWSRNLDYFLSHANNGTNEQYCFGQDLAPQWPFPKFQPPENEVKYIPPTDGCS